MCLVLVQDTENLIHHRYANILLKVLHPGVSCKPIAECNNIYGSDPQHFVTFGLIKPEEIGCLSNSHLGLCVDDQTIPTLPPTPLPNENTTSHVESTPIPIDNSIGTTQTPVVVVPTTSQYPHYNNVQVRSLNVFYT